MRCFPEQREGFYVDIGSGHPVYDNVSFAFYLKGWRGITVEPNPWLSQLSRAVRPRDQHVETLIGRESGEATFFLVEDYHGLSSMIEANARAALSEYGKRADVLTLPLTTLREVCETGAAPASFEFLKIDVEGAEQDVLLGGDWQRFRPKVVVIEALVPVTLAPAWEAWEPILTARGYRYVWFDGLNRYYLAEEAGELAERLANPPASFDDAVQFRNVPPALGDSQHPDHHLAVLLGNAAMTRLPVLDHEHLMELLTCRIPAAELDREAVEADVAALLVRLFGPQPAQLKLPPGASIRDVYAAIAKTEAFRTACGRISASYGW
jgi:FkbM family methyltransferase